MTVEEARSLLEFAPPLESADDLVECPKCLSYSPLRDYEESSVECEDCGDHWAIRCPQCDECTDHVSSETLRVFSAEG